MNEDHSTKENKSSINLGSIHSKTLLDFLFLSGVIPWIYFSIKFGNYISNTYTMMKAIQTSSSTYTSMESPNTLFGFIAGIILFVCLLICWRVICELLLLIFKYLELKIDQLENEKVS